LGGKDEMHDSNRWIGPFVVIAAILIVAISAFSVFDHQDEGEVGKPLEAIAAIYDELEGLSLFHEVISESFQRLPEDLTHLATLIDGDLEKLENIPYYENPFINRDWEMVTFFPNRLNSIELRLRELEIMILEERGVSEDDERLIKAKQRLAQARNYVVID